MLEVAHDSKEMGFEGVGRLLHRLESAVSGPVVPSLPEPLHSGRVPVTPRVSQVLLDGPNATCLQVTRPQPVELLPVLGEKVFPSIEPDESGSSQNGSAIGSQGSVLLLSHLVYSLGHKPHDVKPVKDDLVLTIGGLFDHGVDVGCRHIHGDGLDPCQLLWCKSFKVGRETFATAALPASVEPLRVLQQRWRV